MSYYVTSKLPLIQAKIKQDVVDKTEFRYIEPVVYKYLKSQAPTWIPNIEAQVDQVETRTQEVYYIPFEKATPSSGYSYNHSGTLGDSSKISLAWYPYHLNFGYTLKSVRDNVFGLDEAIMYKMKNQMINFANFWESEATDFIVENRTQVNLAVEGGSFNHTTDVFEISDKQLFIQKVKSVLVRNGYAGSGITMFCDQTLMDYLGFTAAQGAGNSTNYSFQFQGVTFVLALGLHDWATQINSNYDLGFGIAIPTQCVSALTWIDQINRRGLETKTASFSNIINPITGDVLAVHETEQNVDAQATVGYYQDVKIDVQLWQASSMNVTPLSIVGETPLFAFSIVDTLLS